MLADDYHRGRLSDAYLGPSIKFVRNLLGRQKLASQCPATEQMWLPKAAVEEDRQEEDEEDETD